MELEFLKGKINSKHFEILEQYKIVKLTPIQEKAINDGILEGKNLLVCSPTASGKTLVAEFPIFKKVIEDRQKAIYIVPLKALATEKYKDFVKRYSHLMKISLSIGDLDSADSFLAEYDLIICTAEKLDSLIRHSAPWLRDVGIVVIDEIHLLNDPGRGPTLEILITILKQMLNVQIVGLSATIGNPEELAKWLDAELIIDHWRPTKLKKGILYDNKIEFNEE